MYIYFQQNLASRSIKTVHSNLFAKKIESCIKLQLQIVILKKSIMSDMHHGLTSYIYVNFQPSRVSRSVQTVHTNLFVKNRRLHKLQLPVVILKTSIISDIHHRKTYMCIKFQKNGVSRSVKTVHTNLFAKKSQVA